MKKDAAFMSALESTKFYAAIHQLILTYDRKVSRRVFFIFKRRWPVVTRRVFTFWGGGREGVVRYFRAIVTFGILRYTSGVYM